MGSFNSVGIILFYTTGLLKVKLYFNKWVTEQNHLRVDSDATRRHLATIWRNLIEKPISGGTSLGSGSKSRAINLIFTKEGESLDSLEPI